MAASRVVFGRPFKVLMMTMYVASLAVYGLGNAIPIMVGVCPAAMLIAEPVMKAAKETSGMSSTIRPSRIRPRKSTIAPEMTAKAEAKTGLEYCGSWAAALRTTFPVTVDTTATGWWDGQFTPQIQPLNRGRD